MKKRILILFLCVSAVASATTVQEQIVALVPHDTAVYRYGYLGLSAADRAVYDTLLGTVLRFEANYAASYMYHRCDLPAVCQNRTSTQLVSDLKRLQNDVPEFFLLYNYVPGYDWSTYSYYIKIGYRHTPDNYLRNLQSMQAAWQECMAGVTAGMSEYERILTMHDNYCRRTTYGDMTGGDASTAKGSLVNQRAVCEGIARGWLYLCQQAGIPCIYVAGQLLSQGNHAWNYTMVNGQWYLMDCTADCSLATKPGHAGFLRGDDYLTAHYSLYYADGTDANSVYPSLPTLSAGDCTADTPTSLPAVSAPHSAASAPQPAASDPHSATKILRDGQLFILRNGQSCTMQGIFTDRYVDVRQ